MYRSKTVAKSRHVRILELALSGASRAQMVDELPISSASISRYLHTERVQDELDACRAAIVTKALQSFESAFSLALEVYRAQMESPFTSREAKLRAATDILKLGARIGLDSPARDEGRVSLSAFVAEPPCSEVFQNTSESEKGLASGYLDAKEYRDPLPVSGEDTDHEPYSDAVEARFDSMPTDMGESVFFNHNHTDGDYEKRKGNSPE